MAESDDELGYDYQTPVLCGGCETHKNVNSFCLNCDANLCDSCKAQLIHRKHTVLPRTHPKVVAARMSMKLPCKQHLGENYVTYCSTCQKPCCPKCIPKNHTKHDFSELDFAAKGVRDKLSETTIKLDEEILGDREKLRATIEKRLTKTKSDAEKNKKALRQKCQTLRKSIDDMETSLLTQIDKMLKEDTKQLNKQLADIKANEERIRRQLASCNEVMTNASDVHLLISYQNFPDVTSFDIQNVELPGDVEFKESSWTLPSESEIIGRVSQKSGVTSTVDTMRGNSTSDVNQKSGAPVSKRNMSVEEMAKMMKIGTRVRRGRDWCYGNQVKKIISCISIVSIFINNVK